MKPIQEIFPQLAQPRTVVITMHQKPDADAMGSSLAMYHYLRQKGHEVTVISPTNFPDFLKWMPGADLVLDFESMQDKAMSALEGIDLLFCLDFNKKIIVLADRHVSMNVERNAGKPCYITCLRHDA